VQRNIFRMVFAAAFAAMFFLGALTIAEAALTGKAATKVAVMPWKLNAPPELEYLKGAVTDMLSTRLGAAEGIELVRPDATAKAFKEVSADVSLETVAVNAAKKLGADYALVGSISVIGQQISIDAKLVNVKNAEAAPIYAKGEKLDALISMTEYVASRTVSLITAPVGQGVASFGVAGAYNGRFSESGGAPAPATVIAPVTAAPQAAPQAASTTASTGGVAGFIAKSQGSSGSIDMNVDIGPGEYLAFDFMDVNGDGIIEAVLLKENAVLIGKISGNSFKEIATVGSGANKRYVSLERFDSNSDSKDELYISRISGTTSETCRLTFDGKEFALGQCAPYLVRVFRDKGKAVLVGQQFVLDWGFKKKAYVMKAEALEITSGEEFALPDYANIYGTALYDIDADGTEELLIYDREDHLRIYKRDGSGWAEDWKSPDYFTGTLNLIELKRGETSLNEFVKINDEMVFFDADSSGVREIVAAIKTAGGAFGRSSKVITEFKSAVVAGYEWDGVTFVEKWKSKEVPGYVADFTIMDVDGDGSSELVLLVSRKKASVFSSGKKNSILSYKLKL